MEPGSFESLTATERKVLRLVLQQRDQKSVALALGLSPETVKTHLRNAREKCGASTSFSLARAFARHEAGDPPGWVIPLDAVGQSAWPERNFDLPDKDLAEREIFEGVAEQRGAFDFEEAGRGRASSRDASPGKCVRPERRLVQAALLALIVILAIILVFPLAESFQRFANVIEPPSR